VSNIITPQNSNIYSGIPFLVTDDFVKIGNIAYPITHSFIVGERWVHDSCEPAILECYNTMPPMRPLNTSHSAFSSNYGVVSGTFTFACNNMTDSHCLFVGQLSHEYGGSWAIEYDLVVIGATPSGIWQDTSSPWYNPDFTARQTVRIDQFAGENNKKITLAYHSPSRGTGEYVSGNNWTRNDANTSEAGLYGWNWPSGVGEKDVVFWLFDYSFVSPRAAETITLVPRGSPWIPWQDRLTSGSFQDYIKNSPTDPHLAQNWQVSDDLFLPGQSGRRLISRKYWDAPWERYPHLM
jgi:hypothetical protein